MIRDAESTRWYDSHSCRYHAGQLYSRGSSSSSNGAECLLFTQILAFAKDTAVPKLPAITDRAKERCPRSKYCLRTFRAPLIEGASHDRTASHADHSSGSSSH